MYELVINIMNQFWERKRTSIVKDIILDMEEEEKKEITKMYTFRIDEVKAGINHLEIN